MKNSKIHIKHLKFEFGFRTIFDILVLATRGRMSTLRYRNAGHWWYTKFANCRQLHFIGIDILWYFMQIIVVLGAVRRIKLFFLPFELTFRKKMSRNVYWSVHEIKEWMDGDDDDEGEAAGGIRNADQVNFVILPNDSIHPFF